MSHTALLLSSKNAYPKLPSVNTVAVAMKRLRFLGRSLTASIKPSLSGLKVEGHQVNSSDFTDF